jgi:uncharacterized protein (TIGR04255 family)
MRSIRFSAQSETELEYLRPPIVEAVVGVRFDRPLDADVIKKVEEKFQSIFPAREIMPTVDFAHGKDFAINIEMKNKFTDIEGTSVIIFGQSEFGSGKLAPYPGWEKFHQFTMQNFALLRDLTGYRKYSHLGLRYVNRLDIPAIENQPVRIEDYLSILPSSPRQLRVRRVEGYNVSLQYRYDERIRILINSGNMPNVLINYASFLLDIDVAFSENVPQSLEAMSSELNTLRNVKNEAFEACIAESARSLFGAKS